MAKKSVKPKSKPRVPVSRPENLNEDATRLFDRIAEEVCHGDREFFDTLSAHEKKTVVSWFSDAMVGNNIAHDVLWELDYLRKPVSVETFLSDDNYLGRICSGLHQKWREDLINVLSPGSEIVEWVMTGGIGIGKTTISMSAIVYKLYQLSCLRNPAQYYGLLRDSLIVFGIYSITKRQVGDSGYFKLRGFLDSSPYFRNDYPRSMKINSKVVFPNKNVMVIPGSQELHALGLDLFAFAMDEVNFMRVKVNKEDTGKITGQAYDLYNAVHARILSRFIRPGGTIPGIMLLMSSRNAQTSFLEEHLKKVKNSKYTYVSDYPLWACKPAHKFIAPKFSVEVGDRMARSRILNPGDTPRPDAQVVQIPGEFLKTFQEDVDQSLRDIAGVATFNVSPLIRDRQSVFDAIRKDMVHPFTRPCVTIDTQDDILLDEFFLTQTACRVEHSKWVPRINPKHPRFMHIDIGLTGDCAGIGMCHMSGQKRVQRINPDGTYSTISNPIIIMDLLLRIVPPPGSEISLAKLRTFVLFIKKLYPLTLVTFDGFQSADSIQILKSQDVDARKLSVDTDETPYLSLRSALFDRRLVMYEYEPFIDEILDLERDITKKKVDHPKRATKGGKGSKDVTDGACGCVFACLNDPRARKMQFFVDGGDSIASHTVLDPNEMASATFPVKSEVVPNVVTAVPAANVRQIGGRDVDWESYRQNI